MRRADSRDSVYSASSCVSGVGGWQIGDRARLGDRTGRIEFIGTTQFAPGEWIGLVLDGQHGKNDGSVNGVRYFTCDPNHGLFCKSGKLERMASIDSPSRFKSPTPGNSSLGGESSVYATECGYDIGERVLVAGGKLGTVRYLGTADFAQGLWAGVELDQPYGKNDGSVQGKRYFVCKAPYGIFVSASKVQRAPNQNTPVRNDIYHHNKASILRTSRAHGGSHESLSSIGRSSMASSRFGVLKRPGIRPNIVTGNAENNQMLLSLQEAVREKDSHLEKLLAERDSMKEEMAQLHKRIQQLEKSGSASESGSPAPADSKQFDELKQRISKLSAENDELQTQLAEKQSAIENFSFQMDEINIEKDVKIKELEGQLSALTMSSTNANREATAEVEAKIREITEKMQKQEAEFKLNLGKSAENVAQLENELARLKEQYSVQLYELEETVQLKTHSTDEAQAQLTKAKQEIEGLKQQHATFEEAIKAKSSSSEEATFQLAQLKAEIEKMKQQHATLEEAIKQKDASAEELKTHLVKEKEEHEKMKEQVLHLEESVQVKTKIEHELSGELAKANEQIEELKQQHATFEEAIKAKSSSSEEAHLELAQLKAEIEKMKHNHASEVATLQGSIDEEKRLTGQAKEETQRLKQQSAASGEELMSQLTKTKEELERAVAERKQELEVLNQKLAASEEEKRTIQEAFEQNKLQNSAQIEKMTSEGDNLKRDSETLNQKLVTSEEEKRKVQEAFEQINSKNEALQKKIESLEQTNASSESQLTKTNQELQAKIEQMVVIEADLRKKSELADQSLFASEEEKKKLLENLEQVKLQNSSEVESLQVKVVSLEQANASSESQLVKTNQELQAKIQRMIEEGNGLNQKLVANDEEKRKLEGTIEQMKLQLSSLEDSLKMSGATSEQANNHLLELRAEIEKITLEGNHLRQESEALNQKLAVSEEEKRTIQETLEQVNIIVFFFKIC
ncbi:hypothetical protein WR25_22216 isoform A [Diploscapter pachys]|uniref:CAP-Gly domain-containing protein n=2 Tax=Diploscapter pachys TaxID=2018661 RepID=A0A2A2KRW7_9BILA|nr:hypothetical protein WR25_22216 isoform A [Diploscapter pachys]